MSEDEGMGGADAGYGWGVCWKRKKEGNEGMSNFGSSSNLALRKEARDQILG
jgi:hypothetical protein